MIARHEDLLRLMLTSKDHDRDAEDEARYGRHWMDVGAGDWDSERRPSEVRLDRLLTMRESDVRREGAALDRAIFVEVVAAAVEFHPGCSAEPRNRRRADLLVPPLRLRCDASTRESSIMPRVGQSGARAFDASTRVPVRLQAALAVLEERVYPEGEQAGNGSQR